MSGWSCVPCRTCGGDQTRGWHLHDRVTDEPARDTTNDIAAVIAAVMCEHMDLGTSGRWIAEYGLTPDTFGHIIADRLAAHTSHQQDRLAAAWDEGNAAGWLESSGGGATNPYREKP